MESAENFFEKWMAYIGELFKANPGYFGLLLVIIGSALLYSSIKKHSWALDKPLLTDLSITRAVFGIRKVIIVKSIILIIIGIIWFLLYL